MRAVKPTRTDKKSNDRAGCETRGGNYENKSTILCTVIEKYCRIIHGYFCRCFASFWLIRFGRGLFFRRDSMYSSATLHQMHNSRLYKLDTNVKGKDTGRTFTIEYQELLTNDELKMFRQRRLSRLLITIGTNIPNYQITPLLSCCWYFEILKNSRNMS